MKRSFPAQPGLPYCLLSLFVLLLLGIPLLAQVERPIGINFAGAHDYSTELVFTDAFKQARPWITFNAAVPDAQVYSCNLEWFNSLPSDVQEAIVFASDITFRQNLAMVPAARAYAMAEMAKAGVQFYAPTPEEKEQWVAKAGAQLPAWDDIKKELLGSVDKFDALQEAANTYSGYYVHDVEG